MIKSIILFKQASKTYICDNNGKIHCLPGEVVFINAVTSLNYFHLQMFEMKHLCVSFILLIIYLGFDHECFTDT